MRSIVKLTALAICLYTPSLFAQVVAPADYFDPKFTRYNFSFNGGGARAAGMGHAYTAISDDMSAVSWNPAGLLVHDKVAITLSYRGQIPRGSSAAGSFSGTNLFDPNANISSTPSSTNYTNSFNNLSSASIVIPARIKGHPFIGSISLVRNYDEFQSAKSTFGADLPVIQFIAGFPIPFVSPTTFNFSSELHGSLNTVNFGFGTRLYENLAAGLALNVYTGRTYRTERFEQHSRNFPTITNFSPQFVDLDATILSLDSNKFSGFNLSLGFKYQAVKWSAGLVVRTPYSLDVTLDSIQYAMVLFNGRSSGDAADTLIAPRDLTRYKMPLIIRSGFAYNATENLLLALDLEYQGFSGKKILYRTELKINPGSDNVETFREVDGLWENVFAIRGGAEYRKSTSIGVIPLRVGAGFVPLASPSVTRASDNTLSTSGENSINLSLGSGIHWSQIQLDIAYNYSSYNQSYEMIFPWTIAGAFLSSGYESTFNSVPVESKYRNHQVTVSFTGYF